jgi:hypothetical protein
VLLAIDDDDFETIRFVEEQSKNREFSIRTLIGKRGRGYIDLHKKIKELCKISWGDLLFFVADDVEFVTKDWDEKMLAAYNSIYEDNIFWIRTSHTEEGNPYAQCFAITRDWYNITGHLGTCYQQDTEFNFVARRVGREVQMKDIVIIHHRADDRTAAREGEIDRTYLEGRIAADSGLLKGRTVWSPEVQANIIADAIKLLRYIKSSDDGQRNDDDIPARIRALYLEYIKIKLQVISSRIKQSGKGAAEWLRVTIGRYKGS